MINNIIRVEDSVYLVRRILKESTTEDSATKIHNQLGTDTLLRSKDGKWYCCVKAKDADFREGALIQSEPQDDLSHTQFELGDNGGLC